MSRWRKLPDYDATEGPGASDQRAGDCRLAQAAEATGRKRARNGGHFYLAATAADANQYIRDVLVRHDAKLVVKGKSITSEEIRLNHVLEAAGIKVAETTWRSSFCRWPTSSRHTSLPRRCTTRANALPRCSRRKFETDLPLDTGEELTKFAREKLREQFIAADAGISGANLIAADSGSLMLVESEGNIRMTMTLPPLHIAIAGIEKVVPSRERFSAPSWSCCPPARPGSRLTSYVSILHPPLKAPSFAAPGKSEKPREFHLVLIDNGRSSDARRPGAARGAVLHSLQRLPERLRQLRDRRRSCLRRRDLLRRHRRLVGGRNRQADERSLQRAVYRLLALRAISARCVSTSPGSTRTCASA